MDEDDEKYCYNLKARWITIMFINFIFGTSALIFCSLRVNSNHDSYSKSFLKAAIVLTVCMIISGIMIMIAIVKNHHRCALTFSMISLTTLAGTTIYSEASRSSSASFLILLSLFLIFLIGWFIVYSYLQILLEEKRIQEPVTEITAV